MAHYDAWMEGADYIAGDTAFDDDRLFFAVSDHTATDANRPVAGVFFPGGSTTVTSGVDAGEVRTIVAGMFDQNVATSSGLRITFDPDTGKITVITTRNVSFTDISQAVTDFLEGQPPGQYWFVVQKEE